MEEGTDNIYIVDQRHSTAANPQITAGIQIDGSTATMVAGSPTLSNVAGADATPADNHYYEFIYGSQNATDMAGVSVTTFPYLILGNAPFTISGDRVKSVAGVFTTTGLFLCVASQDELVAIKTWLRADV